MYIRENTRPIVRECGEPYNPNNVAPEIEHRMSEVKELIRFAILYLLRNPNFAAYGVNYSIGLL